jgi:hypothetical protein
MFVVERHVCGHVQSTKRIKIVHKERRLLLDLEKRGGKDEMVVNEGLSGAVVEECFNVRTNFV